MSSTSAMTSSTYPRSFDSEPAVFVPDDNAETVGKRLTAVRDRIEAAGGDPAVVRIVAVTKGFGQATVAAAIAAGLNDLGENYATELAAKAGAHHHRGDLPGGARWHYLGAIQRRKVRDIAPYVDCWQSVARAVEGQAIAKHRPGSSVLVQLDVTERRDRNGARPEEIPPLVASLATQGLSVRGVMTVAPRDPSDARRSFRAVRDVADRLGLPIRSMGMSDDLELAVAEGSTMLRIGRALFGDRPVSHALRCRPGEM